MYTQKRLPSDNSAGPFPIGFNYLEGTTINVTRYDVDGVSNPIPQGFSFSGVASDDQPNGSTLTLQDAIPAGYVVVIEKVIDMDTPALIWNQGAEITQKNLRKTTRNLMEMAQAGFDKASFLLALVQAVQANEQGVIDAAQAFADNAEVSATVSDVSADLAQAIYASFDARYLGSKALSPTVNNLGGVLLDGSLYFDTEANAMKVYNVDTESWLTAYVPVEGLLEASSNLGDVPNKAVARANLGLTIGTHVQAYNEATALLDAVQVYTKAQRSAVVDLTFSGSITPDFALGNHFAVTLTGNSTLGNPTNLVAGQSGSIFILQDGTGSRTLSYGSFWDFLGGVAPVLSTTAGTVDRLDYIARTSGSVHAVLSRAWS